MVADDLAFAQRTAPVHARVREHMGLAVGIAKCSDVHGENPRPYGRFGSQFIAPTDGVPEVDVHVGLLWLVLILLFLNPVFTAGLKNSQRNSPDRQ